MKMKKWITILLWIIGTPIVLMAVLLLAYILANKQGVIESCQIGDKNAKYKILIASQGSDFKNQLVDRFVLELKNDSTYLYVMDCTNLKEKELEGWDFYILIHTMQIHKMPKEADVFLSKMEDLNNVLLVSTSGAGDEHYKKLKIDGISTASRSIAIDPIMKWALPKIRTGLGFGDCLML